jgi:DNA-directed RNA polymerase specialized sigma24 family protein
MPVNLGPRGRPAAAWPCAKYCGKCSSCKDAAKREVHSRQGQLQTYEWHGVRKLEPVTKSDRQCLEDQVLSNVSVASGRPPLMSGEEVDLLVGGIDAGHPDDHWRELSVWLKTLTRGRTAALLGVVPVEADVEEVVDDTLVKLTRAMASRSFLLTGAPRAKDPVWAWHHCFTHVFVFRAWTTKIVKRKIIDDARIRARAGRPLDEAEEEIADPTWHPDEPVDHMVVLHRFPELLELIVRQRAAGEVRAVHMCHMLARLPWRCAAAVAAEYPSLGLAEIEVARTDVEMAKHLGTTVGNVQSTRYNFRGFVATNHPELVAMLDVVLRLARAHSPR